MGHDTGNDLNSSDILDFSDNCENLDVLMNADQDYWTDRLGNKRPTIDYALRMAGFTPAGFDFTTGGVLKNGDRNKCVFNQADQTWYSWSGDLPYNVIAGSAPGEGWKVVNRNALTIAREALRRTYLEVGLNLVEGSFETGFTLNDIFDVVLEETTSKVFSGPLGSYPPGVGTRIFTDKSDTLNKFANNSALLQMFPGEDITSILKRAQTSSKPLYMLTGKYIISSPVEIKTDFIAVGGKVVLEAINLPAGAVAVTSNTECDIIGLEIDCKGSSDIQCAFLQNLDFVPTRFLNLDVVTRNVTNLNSSQGATGVMLVLNSNSAVKKVKVRARLEGHNITGTPNDIIGDTAGSSRGVMISINPSGVNVEMTLDDLRASSIYPEEDGDGIHLYDKDLDNLNSTSKYVINNPMTSDCPKRGIKIQAPNTVIYGMVNNLDLKIPGQGSALAFETLAVNTTLINPVVKGKTNLTGDGSILVSGSNFTMINPRFDVAAGQNLIRMSNGAENHSVKGGGITSMKTYASNAFSMITVEDGAYGVIEPDYVNVPTRTGSVIRYQGLTGRHSFNVKGLCQAETFANIAYIGPKANVHLWVYHGDFTGKIIAKVGRDGAVTVHNAFAFTSGKIIAHLEGNVNFIGTGKLKGVENGILYSPPTSRVEISGCWKIECSLGTGIGVDMGSGVECKVTGVETIGFNSGININFNYSEKCVVVNNIGRGGGVMVSSTGAKTLVNRDNDLIGNV